MSGASTAGQARTQAGVLIPRGSISLTLWCAHDTATFYRTRPGLYVRDGFRTRILANAKLVPTGTTYQLAVFELKDATDKQIEAALPKNHLFDESAVCAIVAELIGKQQKGEPGDLEHNGRVNLLYTASCVVFVFWLGGYREWLVDSWDREGRRWDAGGRVVSPA
ncbi:MAG: hypothetical protein WB760_08320 [Xanthobacteraceae bacterium]